MYFVHNITSKVAISSDHGTEFFPNALLNVFKFNDFFSFIPVLTHIKRFV